MQSTLKRCISFVLALVMVLSLLPGQAFATGTEDHDHDHALEQDSTTEPTSEEVESEEKEDETTEEAPAEDDSAAAEPSDLAKSLVERINAVLDTFGITAEMTDEEIKAAINAQPWSVQKPTISEISQIEAMAEDATDADAPYVLANADVETFVRFKEVFKPMFVVMKATSGTYKPVTGVTVGVSGATNTTHSSGTVTVTAKGSAGFLGYGASSKTATITIYNDSESKATLSFDWTATSVNELKIDGTVYSVSSGNFKKVLDAGKSFVVTITTAKNSTTNKLVMQNFAIAAVKETSTVTFQYDSNLGIVTVAGAAVSSGTQQDIASAGADVVATAQNGAVFVGWMNAETRVILSKSASYKLEPAEDMTVQAVFAKNAWFLVDGNKLYDGLNDALAAVASANSKTIVLANNGTLPAGNYIIPKGVTLLIPYNDANTLNTAEPTYTTDTYSVPTVYRKLTMEEGAHITVNGAMSLSAKTTGAGAFSSPLGPCSFVQMQSGSTITVKNGGKLYAWGYIQGSGSVTVEGGATVYECFQVRDWPGGDNATGLIGNEQRVFIMSQYYIQNVEVPMKLCAGAVENGFMSVHMSSKLLGSPVPFIGPSGMFEITDGYIVKDYDENTGRLLIDTFGGFKVKSLSITLTVIPIIGVYTVDSSEYVLPINGNMTITMHSGSVEMTQDIAMLPGSKLIVGEGATCSLGKDNKIYVYDYDQWTTEGPYDEGEGPSFCGTGDTEYVNLSYPTSAANVAGRAEDAYVEINGMADLSKGYVYTTAGGAQVRGSGTIIMKPGTETNTYQVKLTASDSKTHKWFSIPITSAKLQNADGNYVETANNTGVVTYKSVNGIWTCQHAYAEKVTQEATCENSGIKTLTCNCGDSKTETIEKLQHEYVSVVTDPTCTAAGFTTHTCKNGCNDSYTDSTVAALGHKAGAEATCTTAQTCTVCGAELVAALGHKEETLAAKAATCTETGLTEGKKCTVCGEVTVEQTTIDALGHKAGAEATCTEAQTCTVCGTALQKELGHDEVKHDAKAPTCTEKGWDAYVTCSRCDYTTYVEKAALGHAEVKHDAKAPTCTEKGWDAYVTCSRCDYSTYEEKSALGHDFQWVTDKEATVLESGIKHEECSRCHEKRNENTEIPILVCGHEDTMKGTEAKDATCTEDGNSAYWYCSACQNYYRDAAGQHEIEKDSWILAAQGHKHVKTVTYPAGVQTGYVDYTCACGDSYRNEWLDDEAYKGMTIACVGDSITAAYGVNKDENDYVKVLADKLGMNYIRLGDSGTTLATGGSRKCNIDQLTAANLKGANVVTIAMGINDFVAAEKGKYELGDINSTDTATIYGAAKMWCERIVELKKTDSLKNTQFYFVTPVITSWKNSNVRNWDQSVTNNNGYTLRDLCNAIIEVAAQYEIAVIDLNLVSGLYYVDKADNNVDVFGGDGVHPGAEGHAMMAEAIAKVMLQSNLKNDHTHQFGSWITTTWASCLNGQQQMRVCSVCGEIEAGAKGEALGHDEVKHGAQAPTCTEIGWDAYVTCSRCDYSTYEEKASLGHDEVAHEAQAPTCTEIGWDAYVTCSRCDYSTYEEKAALGHAEVKHDAQAPTCKATGWDAYVTCSRCDYTTRGEDLPINPDGHIWDEGEPHGNHSCNTTSYIIYTCTPCKKTNWVVDELKHFRIPIAEEIPATCTTDGMTSGWKCEKCHEFWIPQEVIPALGHDWNEKYPCENETSACTRCDLHFDTKQEHLVVVDPAVAATCTSTGLTEGAHCGYCGKILVAQTETPVIDHTFIVADMEIAARCGIVGHREGGTYCIYCEYDEDPIPALEHKWMHRDAKKATYTVVGWNAHDYCLLCNTIKTLDEYENDPCEFCGDEPEGYMEVPKVEIQGNKTVADTLTNLEYLEQMAEVYAFQNPNADALGLVLNYLRTGVANYTSGSWAIMAGPEDTDFLKFVQDMEDTINNDPELNVWINVSGLKKLSALSNNYGELNVYRTDNTKAPMLSGHFFGTMDMTYHNKGSQNHADVGGWVGDLTDLLGTADEYGVPANLTLDEKVEYIRQKYLFNDSVAGSAGSYGSNDLYADLDAFYFCNELITNGYETGDLVKLMREYYQSGMTLNKRAAYLINNRLDGLSTRKDLRTAVYNAYTSNKLIATLEGTRNFNASGSELTELRKAVCYAFADEMCRLAGDYVEDLTNPRFTVFDTETKILAPGVSQQINYATNADGKQIVYYIATADVMRDDVGVWVNYYDRDPGTPEQPNWLNNAVPKSAQNAQDRYGDPNSPDYIENFNVIASTNAGGYDMSDTATPGGLMVMNGVEWFPESTNAGFFAILEDGTAYMGNPGEYQGMKDRIKEAVGGFGEFVVKDGVVTGNATYSDAPRTSVGITSTGRVVLMCIDGRQAPFSSGASLQDVGYIMKEAGCVIAINLDGGGSTTFVARQPGSDELTVMNRPSDGYPRNVSSNLLIYSTAPSSTAFDHAVVDSAYDYATIGTPVQMTAAGVSPSGSAVDIPEGATWAVANEDIASITEDGVFTGKRLGEVNVYLMLDGNEIGIKRMSVANPDQLYFEKNKVDAIYGSSVVLPLRARIEGKQIAINPNDVTITLSAPAAGSMDGFTFKAVESAFKNLTITASIEGSDASINVMLYKQGENSFDFENATGGTRQLAWHREVTNAKVEDGNIYNVIDPSKEMVASYTFALDMTTIPIPERLKELTYMLPGGTLEGATAWSFLLSLAQRISDLSWVKASIDFDDRFDVDYSELKILNEYFEQKDEVEFDEATNTLTVTMNWIKQSQVIDEATANPLCLISGIKLTPKDGAWDDVTKIEAVTSGTIGYELYMRASGLYGFAQKPENQAIFGLMPYRNPADTSDAGGYFRDTYAQITDTFTMVNVLKEGWVNEDGGFAYYIEGERLTGVKEVEGFYYDFGENGINVGQTKYTGVFFDEDAKVYRYSYIGVLTSGWQSINDEWYYFKPGNMVAATGRLRVSGVYFDFEENGKLVSGVWMNTLYGRRYYYGPTYYVSKWAEIDEEMYYFEDGYPVVGVQSVSSLENRAIRKWYDFGEDGACQGTVTGIYERDGEYYYIQDGLGLEQYLVEYEGNYYFTNYAGRLTVNERKYAWISNCDLPKGWYTFGADGKMVGGSPEGEIVELNGVRAYYENGAPTEKYLVCVDGDYYFANYNGRLTVNETIYAWATNCDMPKGRYTFGPDGKMLGAKGGEIVEIDGILYYFERGSAVEKGLVCVDGEYYFTVYGGRVLTNQTQYTYLISCDFPKGSYEFGADGKMIGSKDGEIVEKDGTLYYYEKGKPVEKGLVCVDGEYYFSVYTGRVLTNQIQYTYLVNCDFAKGSYEFGPDGKMVGSKDGEIVEKDGTLYYYEKGKPIEKGLVCVDGEYYFSVYKGRVLTNQTQYTYLVNCDFPKGSYEFGADGKMVGSKAGEIVEKSGTLYYYENGVPVEKGLVCVDGDYYFSVTHGRVITNQVQYAYITNCDLPKDSYEFGADGKMRQGFTEIDGVLYLYKNGKTAELGLVEFDGEYYFVVSKGRVITNETAYAYMTSCDLPKGHYTFDADGKMIGSGDAEIVEIDGALYYYEKGKPVEKGLVYLDGYYYFAVTKGRLVVNQKQHVYQGNGLLVEATYIFNERGQIIGW